MTPPRPGPGGRIVLPWLATGLLGAAAAGGALGGALGSPGLTGQAAGAWVARLMATTRSAGSARVRTTSTMVLTVDGLRQTHTSQGHGVLDIGERASAISGVSTQTFTRPRPSRLRGRYTAVTIGHTLYLTAGGAGRAASRQRVSFGPGVLASVSVQPTGSPYGPLARPATTQRVEALGSSVRTGVDVREYLIVGTAPSCSLTVGTPTVEVWVDGHGRLVAVRSSVRATLSGGSVLFGRRMPGGDTGHLTMTTTASLGAYRGPVRLSPPFLTTTPPPPRGLPRPATRYPMTCSS